MTEGRVALTKHGWTLYGPPQLLIKAKRVFAAANPTQTAVVVSDTLDNCRDLDWFLLRYPDLEVSPEDRKKLTARAKEHRKRELAVARMLHAPKTPMLDHDLAKPLRDYQARAVALAMASGGLLVADDLGLGKTAVGIACVLPKAYRPALVVCQAHLQRQWEDQFHEFAPGLRVERLKSTQPYAFEQWPDVVISSYHKFPTWAPVLGPKLKAVVYDEVQELRRGPERGMNTGSKKGTAAKSLAERRRIRMRVGLSATPIYNYGGEIFNILEVLRPGALGTRDEFTREWGSSVYSSDDKVRLERPDAFGDYLKRSGLMVRRTRGEVGRELPDLVKIPHAIESDEDAFDKMKGSAYELARIILFQNHDRRAAFRAGGELDALMRQATGIAKAPYVAWFVKMLLEAGERVVLGGWHREVYKIWQEHLGAFHPALYTGSESEAQKHEAKRRFVAKETPLLILSLRSGAGLDGLQYADCRNIVYGELDWSPAVHEQFSARLHRDGQRDKIMAYYLISNTGSDPIVADVLGVKRAQLDGIRDPGGRKDGLAKLDVGGAHVKLLAQEVLRRAGRGWAAPDAPVVLLQEDHGAL